MFSIKNNIRKSPEFGRLRRKVLAVASQAVWIHRFGLGNQLQRRLLTLEEDGTKVEKLPGDFGWPTQIWSKFGLWMRRSV
jgi:hypothetical protein